MHGAGLDPKAAAFQHGAKRSTGGRLQRVEPDDQRARATQEVRHPIERRLDRFDRTLPSIEESHVVLPGREAAVRRSGRASVTQTMQIDHGLGAVGTGHDDFCEFGAMRQRDNRLDEAFACRCDSDRAHDGYHCD